MCDVCNDRGIGIWWPDEIPPPLASRQYVVCLCPKGQFWRVAENRGHQVAERWRVWCAREQVAPEQVYLLEEAATAEELAAWGFRQPEPSSGLEAVVSAARGKGRVRL